MVHSVSRLPSSLRSSLIGHDAAFLLFSGTWNRLVALLRLQPERAARHPVPEPEGRVVVSTDPEAARPSRLWWCIYEVTIGRCGPVSWVNRRRLWIFAPISPRVSTGAPAELHQSPQVSALPRKLGPDTRPQRRSSSHLSRSEWPSLLSLYRAAHLRCSGCTGI